MGDQGKNPRWRRDQTEEVPETLPGGGEEASLDRQEGVRRAREEVESCGPGMVFDRREVENSAYWLRNAEDYDPSTLQALEYVHRGGVPCTRDTFHIAFLISQHCVDWDENTDALSITDKGLDCLSFFREV